jgi:hypothetical protein
MGIAGGPNIIESGLVDAYSGIDKNSYSGTGGTWYSLVNGGTSPGDPSWANNASQITVQLWLEKTGTGTGYANHPVAKWNTAYNVNASFILYHFENYLGNNQDGLLVWYGYTTGNGWTGIAGSGAWMVSGEIANIVLQFNTSNGGGIMWKNGAKTGGRSGTTGNIGPTTSATAAIGLYGPEAAGTSKVKEIYFYNRELSDNEIIYNYNANKSRYGL